jgi:anti-sigma-K factor RskA
MNPDVHTLTGAYALDALSELERRQFEHHLAECPDCAREVEELRATAARLGAAVAQRPPDHLRSQVLAQITVTRQEPPRGRGQGARPPRRWALRLTAVAAAACLAAAIALGVVVVQTRSQLDGAQQQLAQAKTRYGPVAAVLDAPDAHVTVGTGTVGGSALVAVSHRLDQAVVLMFNAPYPPARHTLQVWAMGAGSPRSLGLVQPEPGVTIPPLVFGDLGGEKQIGVTVEPAGGSRAPTTTPVMLFDLPA